MSYRRRHLWFRRVALGFAFAAVIFAGRVSLAAAQSEEGPDGSVYVTAGGWSGMVDAESGIPLSAGIPYGNDRILPEEEMQVIPYLSHGILTEEDAKAESARALVSREMRVIPYLSHGILTEEDAKAESARALVSGKKSVDRPDGDEIAIKNVLQSRSRLSLEELAFVNAVIGAAESLHDPLTAEPQGTALGNGGEVDGQEQSGSSEYLTPQHQGTDYPE